MTGERIHSAGELLPDLLTNLGLTPRNYAAISFLEKELSDASKSAKIVGFKEGRVFVEVESPAELQDLSLKKPRILDHVRSSFPSPSGNTALELKLFLKGMGRPGAQEFAKGIREKV